MSYAPSINWSLALALGGTGSRGLPEVDSRQVQQLVADLRVTARRAGELAAARLGVDSPGASRISVVDWAGWGRAVRSMIEATVHELDLPRRPAGPLNRVRGAGNAVLLGSGLRMASRRLLGQFDAYTGSDTLYLVAPTIVAHERSHGFVPSDFRLWVALHEQTHALQFRAAPGCEPGSPGVRERSSRTTRPRFPVWWHGRAPATSPRCSRPARRGRRSANWWPP